MDTGTQGARAPRWMKLALALSLGANLLVASLVVGQMWRGASGPEREMRRSAALALGPLGRALAPQDRRAIAQALRADKAGMQSARREIEAGQGALLQALRADPFERAALAQRLAAQSAQTEALLVRGRAALLDRLEAMSPAERQAFADRFEAGLHRGGRDGTRDGIRDRPAKDRD